MGVVVQIVGHKNRHRGTPLGQRKKNVKSPILPVPFKSGAMQMVMVDYATREYKKTVNRDPASGSGERNSARHERSDE
jgi:hypothetical protein